MSSWTASDIPDQSGRIALVTGATSGLGLSTATELARHGARVLLGSRNPEKGATALRQVRAVATGAEPELVTLDLADLASVRAAATDVRERSGGRLDLLVNNAGLMAPPLRLTVDGFELQWATNHLGHAALTWLLYPALATEPGSRVVTVSSLAHRQGHITPTELAAATTGAGYRPWPAYGRSKLANLLFAFELHRRLRVDDPATLSVAAHPGFSSTGLVPAMMAGASRVARAVADAGARVTGQSADRGALPQLYAATAPGVRSGEFYGPSGPGQLRGAPKRVRANDVARDVRLAEAVWALTAEQTGVDPMPSHTHPSGPSDVSAHG